MRGLSTGSGVGTPRRRKSLELKETLYKKRGEKAVTQLIEEMRRQWGSRHEWQGEPHE